MASGALQVELLELARFRNLARLSFRPGPHFNVIHGDNGAGKSSLLEALYYLAALRSFRTHRGEDLIQQGEQDAVLRCVVPNEPLPNKHAVMLRRGGSRKVQWNGKRPTSLGGYMTKLPMVLFHPGHLSLASGGPDLRRAFLDRVLEQLDPTYSQSLKSYEKALRSRNRLLKSDTPSKQAILAFNPILAETGAVLGQSRTTLVADLKPLVEDAFREVTDSALPLSVEYAPRVEPKREAIMEALEASLTKDLGRGFTAAGPHLDEVHFEVTESKATARHHASQGQQRALVLALKIAELQVLARRGSGAPILLLDDVSSELDRNRNRRLFERLQTLGGQVFLTTTHPEFILLKDNRVDFEVEAGVVKVTNIRSQ